LSHRLRHKLSTDEDHVFGEANRKRIDEDAVFNDFPLEQFVDAPADYVFS
jgi:hypothetical protein